MSKNIQIPAELYCQICEWFLDDSDLSVMEQQQLIIQIKAGLIAKNKALEKRAEYTGYKTSKDPQQAEAHRQRYNDLVGRHKNFRY